MLCAILMVVCWLATHGRSQLWGNRLTGRYSTDWNGCSVACMTDVEAGLLRSDAWAGDLENDQVLGAMLLDASFVHHALAVLDEGQRRQYQFWQAVFGTECLDGS